VVVSLVGFERQKQMEEEIQPNEFFLRNNQKLKKKKIIRKKNKLMKRL
jgi:hypothetical protein